MDHDSRRMFIGIVLAAIMATTPVSTLARSLRSSTGGRGYHYVSPHATKNGTYVSPHYQTNPNDTKGDNWSTRGNVNPFTGKPGTKSP